jgi:DNA-binding protein HU-beta
MVYSVYVDALHFDNSIEPLISQEYYFLRPLYIIVITSLVISVIVARVFLGFISGGEKLESVADYKKQQDKKTKKKEKADDQVQLRLRGNELLLDSETYTPKKERTRKLFGAKNEGDEIKAIDAVINNIEQSKKEDEELLVKEEIVNEETVVEVKEVSVEEIAQEHKESTKQYYTRLNKAEINKIVSRVLDISIYKSRKTVNAILSVIQEELVAGKDVKIDDFGKFHVHKVKEHNGINPKTQESIIIPEHNIVKFQAYKHFKDAITNDVVATGDKYLLTDTVKRDVSEEQLRNELNKEADVREHIEDTVVEPILTKPMKKKKPAVPKKTKKDIIELVANTTDLNKSKMNKFLKSFNEVVSETLANRSDISIKGFGKFTTIEIPEKEAVNPSTNEAMIVPKHHQVRLRFDEEVKGKIRN